MSITTNCPTPKLCKVATHQSGTAAAVACHARRSRGRRTPTLLTASPPPAPTAAARPQLGDLDFDLARSASATTEVGDTGGSEAAALRGRALEAVRTAVLADLERTEQRDGWDPDSGLAHPSGGHTHRMVSVLNGGGPSSTRVDVHYADAPLAADPYSRLNAHTHRVGGPATIRFDLFGQVTQERWVEHGQLHRDDGPAVVYPDSEKAAGSYYHQGVSIVEDSRTGDLGERCTTLVGFGADPATVVGWLAYEQEYGRRTTRALLKAGVEAKDAKECAEAGVTDVSTVAAVARGELPLSWAVAGA